jgi:hypothetical protein
VRHGGALVITRTERAIRKIATSKDMLALLRLAAEIGAQCDRAEVVRWLRKRHARWGTMATAIESGKHLEEGK